MRGTPAGRANLTVTPVSDTPWVMHEFTLTDPDGNNIRVGWSWPKTTETRLEATAE